MHLVGFSCKNKNQNVIKSSVPLICILELEEVGKHSQSGLHKNTIHLCVHLNVWDYKINLCK